MKECCMYCRARGVGCQMFCERYKSDYDNIIKVNHIRNRAERSSKEVSEKIRRMIKNEKK